MAIPSDPPLIAPRTAPTDGSAVSWAAVFAGAVGAAAFSLILFLLGTGIGLAVVSPWANDGASAEAIGVSSIVWVTVVQILASVLGGYLAGRLRTRWVTVHTNEVYFRDTAHGFLAWSVATLLMATLLSSAVASSLAMGVKAGGAAMAAAAPAAGAAAEAASPGSDATDYFADVLLRAPAVPTAPANTGANASDTTAEVVRVFAHGIAEGELSSADSQHLAQLVAARTGMSPADADRRVTDTFNQLEASVDAAKVEAKAAADKARKASAHTAIWLVVSLLIGAFLASVSATFGGRLRDSSVLAQS